MIVLIITGDVLHLSHCIRKPTKCLGENKGADQLRGVSTFAFATWIVQSLFFLHPKFQASSCLLSLHRLVCVGPGRKPTLLVFSRKGSFHHFTLNQNYVMAVSPFIASRYHQNGPSSALPFISFISSGGINGMQFSTLIQIYKRKHS